MFLLQSLGSQKQICCKEFEKKNANDSISVMLERYIWASKICSMYYFNL